VTSYLGTGEEQMKMLAAAIDGQPIQNGQAQIDPNQLAQRIEQQVLSRFQQQQEENWGQQATEEVQSFSTDKEFFDDVRETMGDLMEVAAKRGVAMSMDQAYTKACQLDEGIAEVLGQRAAAERANASTASTQQIRAAASSVKSEPAGVTASPNPDSVRGAIELAYERAMGR